MADPGNGDPGRPPWRTGLAAGATCTQTGPHAMLTLLNHRRCNPDHHRTTADESLNEHRVDGRLTCEHCGKPMFFCGRAAKVNKSEPGYQLTYLHDTNEPEKCGDSMGHADIRMPGLPC